ncbi:DSBA oxidoreductase [Kineosporia sp. NBRC 101677]|uniref:DsbA family oxidoreductase n=1 Tax=Kineosporia sp. NBRC 101677 TaxID=3032197 RepID=UPI0024A381D2|nr:DsbA family oxidoreductase [Kineosporia sp. NBRC 101677]GLY15331.1 DSBA oxidoreductase [Kineosporia sp. NBRC 101677]
MAGNAFGPAADPIVIDVWSDVVCPFCYLGDAVLKQAIDEHPGRVEVRYHSFQLHPGATGPMKTADYLAGKVNLSKAQIEASHEHLSARGAEAGLDFRFDDALVANTRDAHRLIHFAKTADREHEMVLRLFRAEFTEGLDVSDHGVLADLAAEVGLERAAAAKTLAGNDFEAEFEADIAQARQLGISGVPFFVFDGKRAVSGAQPVELFRRALELSTQDRAGSPA